MTDDTKREGPICFRMNQPDYNKFSVYVDSTDLSKSKIAERAVLEYLDEQDEPEIPRYVSAGMLATVAGVGLFLTLIITDPGTLPDWLLGVSFVLLGYAAASFSVLFIKKLAE